MSTKPRRWATTTASLTMAASLAASLAAPGAGAALGVTNPPNLTAGDTKNHGQDPAIVRVEGSGRGPLGVSSFAGDEVSFRVQSSAPSAKPPAPPQLVAKSVVQHGQTYLPAPRGPRVMGSKTLRPA
jgi:hypothetical protein